MNKLKNLNINLITLGESSVGKSSIINRYTENVFNFSFVSTIGIEFRNKTIKINNNEVNVKIWDTAGQELYRSIQKQYYKNNDGILLIFDVTNRQSFNLLENWINDIKNQSSNDVVVIIVGNKIDLDDRIIEDIDIKKFADKYHYTFFTTSAATGENINECFEFIINEVYKIKSQKILNNQNDNYQIKNFKQLTKTKNCCRK